MSDLFLESAVVSYEDFPVKFLLIKIEANVSCFRMHWHERIECLHIDEGSMDIVCGDESFTAVKGDFVTFHSRKAHSAKAGPQGVSYQVLMFEPPSLANGGASDARLLNVLNDGFVQFRTRVSDMRISALVDAIADERDCMDAACWLIAKGHLCILLGFMFRHYQREDTKGMVVDRQFRHVLKYIDEHYTKPISAKQLADEFSYEASYFCRKFKQSTGLSTVQYIRILRLDLAHSLLRSSDTPVHVIAKQCGYDDANYFTRCFQRRYGVSPSRIRKETTSSLKNKRD